MSHTIGKKRQLLVRVRRIAGQVSAIENALESEDGCSVILQRIAAARGALNGLMAEVLELHMGKHVVSGPAAKRAKAADEIMDAVRTYLK